MEYAIDELKINECKGLEFMVKEIKNKNQLNRKGLGYLGEDMAEKMLKLKGYIILKKNFKCKMGEIDIIALKNDCIYFIEVKTRTSQLMGRPSEAVDTRKKKHIINTASYFMNNIGNANPLKGVKDKLKMRFSVFEILVNEIENAF